VQLTPQFNINVNKGNAIRMPHQTYGVDVFITSLLEYIAMKPNSGSIVVTECQVGYKSRTGGRKTVTQPGKHRIEVGTNFSSSLIKI